MSKSTSFYVFKALEAVPFSGMRVIIIAMLMIAGFVGYGIYTGDYHTMALAVGNGLAFIFTRESIRKSEASNTYIKSMLEGLSAAEPLLPTAVQDVVNAEKASEQEYTNG